MSRHAFAEPAAASSGELEPRIVNRGRSRLVYVSLLLFALAIIARAAQLQIYEGDYWTAEAIRLQVRVRDVPAERGRILDATGEVIAETREFMQLNITPANIKSNSKFPDAKVSVKTALEALGVSPTFVRKSLDVKNKSVLIPGLYRRDQVAAVAAMPGVNLDRRLVRDVSAPPGFVSIVGRVAADGTPAGGIEQEFDELLRGSSGQILAVARWYRQATGISAAFRDAGAGRIFGNSDAQEIAAGNR